MRADHPCPCGLPQPYAACCGALHRGERRAMTAEALMRSRYAAFSVGDLDYLVATLHPSKRRPDERAQLADGADRLRWVGLTIQDTRGGTALDTTGEVAFEAAYLAGKVRGVLRERSRFVREADGWYYLDGDV